MDSVCDLFTVNKQQTAVKKIVTELANDLFRKLKSFDRLTLIWPKFTPQWIVQATHSVLNKSRQINRINRKAEKLKWLILQRKNFYFLTHRRYSWSSSSQMGNEKSKESLICKTLFKVFETINATFQRHWERE